MYISPSGLVDTAAVHNTSNIYRIRPARRPTKVRIPAALPPLRNAPLLEAGAPVAVELEDEVPAPVAAEPADVAAPVAAAPEVLPAALVAPPAPPAPAALDEAPAADEPDEAVEAVNFAAAWKAAKVFRGVALIENTIPAAQWSAGLVCAQKNHNGELALLTVILHCGSWVAPAATAWKPESTPPDSFVHGAAKLDCVTE